MKERFYNIVHRPTPIAGVGLDFSPLLWSIVCASAGKTPQQIEQLVLGQLSPASPFAVPIDGVTYPDEHGTDELLRFDKYNDLAKAVHEQDSISLKELLEVRLGTPQTYAIVLAVALSVHGHDCEIAVAGPDADPSRYPFLVVAPDRQVDLFTVATGGLPTKLRPHRTVKL